MTYQRYTLVVGSMFIYCECSYRIFKFLKNFDKSKNREIWFKRIVNRFYVFFTNQFSLAQDV